MAATYAAKQEAWYKEHAGAVQDGCSIAMGSYTDRQTGQVIEVGACFVAGTKIQTPDGEVNIEDIQAGDQVFACNVDTGEVGVKEVKQTFVREVNILVHVFVGEEEIITTTNHPFYVVGRGFVKAEDLRIGYTLLQLDGSTEKISRIVVENLGAPVKVYNFEVEDWHTYYVSSMEIMVHNMCANTNGVIWNNGWRTSDGKFASPMGEGTPGGWAEEAVWDSIDAKEGWTVKRGRIYTQNDKGDVRVYDGVAISPKGNAIGIEVKSGSASYGGRQKQYDSSVSANNPVFGIGKSKGLIIKKTIVIRRTIND